jgi:hypothetical protein
VGQRLVQVLQFGRRDHAVGEDLAHLALQQRTRPVGGRLRMGVQPLAQEHDFARVEAAVRHHAVDDALQMLERLGAFAAVDRGGGGRAGGGR